MGASKSSVDLPGHGEPLLTVASPSQPKALRTPRPSPRGRNYWSRQQVGEDPQKPQQLADSQQCSDEVAGQTAMLLAAASRKASENAVRCSFGPLRVGILLAAAASRCDRIEAGGGGGGGVGAAEPGGLGSEEAAAEGEASAASAAPAPPAPDGCGSGGGAEPPRPRRSVGRSSSAPPLCKKPCSQLPRSLLVVRKPSVATLLDLAEHRPASEPSWRAGLLGGCQVEILVRDDGPRWARGTVVSARRQNLSVMFQPRERTYGSLHTVLPRSSRRLRRAQLGQEERSRCVTALHLPWPQPQSPGCRPDQERQAAAPPLSQAAARRPAHAAHGAMDVPMSRAETVSWLVRQLQEEVKQCNAQVAVLRKQNWLIRQHHVFQPSLQELAALFAELGSRAPLAEDEEVEPQQGSAGAGGAGAGAGVAAPGQCADHPQSRQEMRHRLLALFKAELAYARQEAAVLRHENKALWHEAAIKSGAAGGGGGGGEAQQPCGQHEASAAPSLVGR